jgi:tetratricopeptide (TPR) repeat protein
MIRGHSSAASLFTLFLLAGGAASFCQNQNDALLFRQAQALEQGGDLERAVEIYGGLLRKDPANIVYIDRVQYCFIALKRYDEAIALLRRQLTVRVRDISLQSELGNVYHKMGRDAEAQAAWDTVIAWDVKNQQAYRIVAIMMIENRLLERAAALYQQGRATCGDPRLFTLELAQLYAMTMDYRGATTEYLRHLKLNAGQLPFVQSRLGSFSWKEEGRAAAIDVVKSSLKASGDLQLYELLGWLQLEGKDFEGALETHREIDGLTKAQGEVLYAFAGKVFKEGAYAIASKAYAEAIAAPLAPAKLPAAEYGYALALKEMDAVADTLEEPLTGRFAAVPGEQQRFGRSLAYFRKIVAAHPHTEYSAKAYYQIGCLQFERLFDLDGARASFASVLDEVKGMPQLRYDVFLKMGAVEIARGDSVKAEERFLPVAAAPDALPDQTDEANVRLAELDYYRGHSAKAVERLKAIALNPGADYANDALLLQTFLQSGLESAPGALVRFALADFFAKQRRYSEALSALDGILEAKQGGSLLGEALYRKGALLSASGRFAEALEAYGKLLGEYRETSTLPDRAQFQIGEVYQFGMRDAQKAIAAYERLLVDYPASVMATIARLRIRHLRGGA